MKRKERGLVFTVTILILVLSGLLITKKENFENLLKHNKITSNLYKNNQKKRIENILDSKLKSSELKNILFSLSIDKLDIANSILKDSALTDFLNTKDTNELLKTVDYDTAVKNLKVAQGIVALEGLSPELKNYLRNNVLKDNYEITMTKIKNRPEVIKMRERIPKLLPIKGTESTLENLPEKKLIEISEILLKSPETVEFVEKKDLSKYNLEQIVLISKTLYDIGKIDPTLAIRIADYTKGFDIRKAALYGDLYVRDEKYEKNIIKDFNSKDYTFENPYLKKNPYGRTPLAYALMFKTEEKNIILRTTVLGRDGVPNYTYDKDYKSGEIYPIVGLYPNCENTIRLQMINKETNKLVGERTLKLKTDVVDDRLPAIVIEKRVPTSIQSGVNLVSYNLESEGLPFAFDSMGNIRYILETGKDMRKVRIEKGTVGDWKIKNDEDTFQLDILGKIMGRIGRDTNQSKLKNKKTKYLIKNNNLLTVISYKSGPYPYALFSEYGLDTKDEVFRAVIYYDKNSASENIIEDGERINLYEGDVE